MSKEIVNRVAQSQLVSLDLEDFYPVGNRVTLDIAPWLFEGMVLREKPFREIVNTHNWDQYKDQYVAIYCSTEAIVPLWAYMLITTCLASLAKRSVVGSKQLLEETIFSEIIASLDLEPYRDKPVIIKGCSKREIPENAYILLTQKLLPIVKSLMFGEACSSVPLFKKK